MMKLTITGKDDKPVAGAAAGTFAIFDAGPSGTDYAPFLNPKQNLSRVALHSDLDYIGAKTTLTANFTLAAGSYASDTDLVSHEIGAHGEPGRPLIMIEYSLDETNWFSANGTSYVNIGQTLRGRNFHIQVDETKVYAVFSQIGALPAITVYFRVHILERSFGGARPSSGKAFRATPDYIEAAGGVFDTRRRYLQEPAAGQTPDIIHASGQTIKVEAGNETNELDIGFGSTGNNLNIPLGDIWSTSWPPYIVQANKVELVFKGPGSLAPRARLEPGRVRLSDASGDDVFDSARKIVSFVEEMQTTIVVPARSAAANDGPHDVVHYSNPVADGADIILGYMELKSASMRIDALKPMEFSGTIIVTGFYHVLFGNLYVRALSCLYPRLNAGNLEIVEHYFNRTMSGAANNALPTYTVDCHMFVCARTGGLS